VHHLRCSIIGPEPKSHVSLLDWFRRQPRDGRVNGYSNHTWNGVTTLHFARLCHAIVTHWMTPPRMQHVVPSGALSKAQLLSCFAAQYRREDLTITPTEAASVIDRTLGTVNETMNRELWQAAGYPEPPSVPQMVAELAAFDYTWDKRNEDHDDPGHTPGDHPVESRHRHARQPVLSGAGAYRSEL
jgi:dTDP-4-dehydrorhamnose reductase